MIGLDTNVLVQYLAQDDPEQSALATRIMEDRLSDENPGFVGLVALAETAWVLERLYSAGRREIIEVVSDLLATSRIVIENRAAVSKALSTVRTNQCAFADALIAASAGDAGCSETISFDRGAVRAGMTLLKQ